jgi:hypothetical protein
LACAWPTYRASARYRQRAVAETEGVPFRRKIDLVVLVVEAVQAWGPLPRTASHVLVDSWYTGRRLGRACAMRGFDVTGGLKANRGCAWPTRTAPPATAGNG